MARKYEMWRACFVLRWQSKLFLSIGKVDNKAASGMEVGFMWRINWFVCVWILLLLLFGRSGYDWLHASIILLWIHGLHMYAFFLMHGYIHRDMKLLIRTKARLVKISFACTGRLQLAASQKTRDRGQIQSDMAGERGDRS